MKESSTVPYQIGDRVRLLEDTLVILRNRGYDRIPAGSILLVHSSPMTGEPGIPAYLVRQWKRQGVFTVMADEIAPVFDVVAEEYVL